MKKLVMLGMAIVTFAGANAQVNFGVKGGLNLSNFRGSDVEGVKGKAGFYGGVTAEFDLAKNFHLRPELVFSLQGVKASEDEEGKINTSYVNIPVMVSYSLANGFYGETGPQFGFLTGANMKYDGEKISMKEVFKKTDLSWGVGIGYMSKMNLGVNARYNLGLSKITKEGDGKVYNGVLQVGLVYAFKTK